MSVETLETLSVPWSLGRVQPEPDSDTDPECHSVSRLDLECRVSRARETRDSSES